MARAASRRLFPRAPDISHVAAPYCFGPTWRGGDVARTTKLEPACIDNRSCSAGAICDCYKPLHCFFYTVLKDKNKRMPTSDDLSRFVSLINHEPVLRGLLDKLRPNPPCSRPFGVGAIYNRPAVVGGDSEYTVSGVTFHCHCKDPFSVSCWKGAAAAAAYMRSASAGGAAARNSERRRAAC
ncbi:nuclear protein UL55 [Leporid alphaherpesvirus 4]|uniref:Nuclear protein UL55 n=1 Tax=Leporid alphaherpesvirus 4 TaxID=481315 RepID=J9QVE1_9ALPH|nr:nuclear protein UL55 [Leporid alphaherpesvirus 4]AFR32500.1 nuclear protein UL55 [Leporid alphaherpesvirus 4]